MSDNKPGEPAPLYRSGQPFETRISDDIRVVCLGEAG
jgi:hypothetical protein